MLRKASVPFREARRFWLKLGFISFGGPAGQIAIMHRELVEQRKWVAEELFLRALNFCMMLPGPEAQQLAIYIGWRLHGTVGGIVAGAFFVIPSVFVLLGLSWLAAAHAGVPAVAGLFYGIQPVVVAIVVEAVIRIGKRTLRHPALFLFAAAAFVALRFLSLPFPLVILAAAMGGLLLQRRWPQLFQSSEGASGQDDPEPGIASPVAVYPPLRRIFKLFVVFFILWALPVGYIWLWRGGSDVLTREALFFTKAAFVTFGGAYAVLSYIADMAVNHYGWLDARQMVLGLGLAESTPGPLIMVTQYVGFLGAWRSPGGFNPFLYGTLGALVTTYVTFIPCFFFIFAGSPYIEALAGNRRIRAALTSVTAAVVGVIMNLALFFGSRVIIKPDGYPDGFALAEALLAFLLLWRYRLSIHIAVAAGGIAGMAWRLWV